MHIFRFILFFAFLGSAFGATAQTPTVWPGDADNNGIVNNLDFLQLGLAYNYIGPVRPAANVQWTPQSATPFSTNPNGINSAHADADGNGLVNYLYDAFPIFVHYGLSRPNPTPSVYQMGALGLDPQVDLDASLLNGQVTGGQSISLPIVLGTDSIPVEDLYGFAFSVHVDPQFVSTQQATFNFNEISWANHDNDRFSAAKTVSDSRIDVAWVRTDHNHRSGFGRIGRFDFIIIDDVVGLQQNMQIIIDSIKAIDRFGNEFAMAGDTLTLIVTPSAVTATKLPKSPETTLTISPNPSQGELRVQCAQKMLAIRVYDAFGKIVQTQVLNSNNETLHLQRLPKGMYVVEVDTENGRIRRQVFLQ